MSGPDPATLLDAPELVCPLTRQALHPAPVEAAEAEICKGEQLAPLSARGPGPGPVGRTATVLVRDDGACAYPVLRGIPVLLGRERLLPPGAEPEDPAATGPARAGLASAPTDDLAAALERARFADRFGELIPMPSIFRKAFPEPRGLWIDAGAAPGAQWDAYLHLAPLDGKRVLQVGGPGRHAVVFLLAGAERVTLVDPRVSRLEQARLLAVMAQVGGRLRTVAGLAEELPVADASMDAVHAAGALHHSDTSAAGPELARVLAPGGRLAALEPWRGRRQGAGPAMTAELAAPLAAAFARFEVRHHGAMTSPALLALAELGLELTPMTVWRIHRADDALSSLLPRLRARASGAALLGWRDLAGG